MSSADGGGGDQPPSPPPPPPPAPPPDWPSGQSPFQPPGYAPPPGYGQQPGYGPPGYNPQWQQPYATPVTNGMAIASMVLGILWLYWIGSILALVFGYIAKRQIDEAGGRQSGRGMAVAGIVLGWIGVGFLALFVLFGLGFAAMGSF